MLVGLRKFDVVRCVCEGRAYACLTAELSRTSFDFVGDEHIAAAARLVELHVVAGAGELACHLEPDARVPQGSTSMPWMSPCRTISLVIPRSVRFPMNRLGGGRLDSGRIEV